MTHQPVVYDTYIYVITELHISSNEHYLRNYLFASFVLILVVTTPLNFLWRIFKIHLSIHDIRGSILIQYPRLRRVL